MGWKGMVMVRGLVVGLVLLAATVAGAVIPSPPFNATGPQGRPLVGATVGVTNSAGGVVTVYSNAAGTVVYGNVVPSTGVVQFYGASGDYVVTISGSGVSRTYAVNIPALSDALTEGDFGTTTGLLRQFGSDDYGLLKINTADIADPAVTNDTSENYVVGSYWINITTGTAFIATDVTDSAAVWKQISNSTTVPDHATQHNVGGSDEVEFYASVEDEGVALTQRRTLNMVGAGVTCVDDNGNMETDCTISGGGGGSGITTLNTLTADPQVFAVGSSGTDFNISSVTATHTFNIPSASTSNRGLITAVAQTIGGAKTFNTAGIYNEGLIINESGLSTSDGNSRIETNTESHALFFDSPNDRIGIFSASTVGGFDIFFDTRGNNTGMWISGSGSGSGILSTSNTGNGLAATSVSGVALYGQATGEGHAGQFVRSFAATTDPIVEISRNNGSDVTSMLKLIDTTPGSAYMLEGSSFGVTKWGINSTGQYLAAENGSSALPEFTSISDANSGISLSGLSGGPCLVDEGVELLCVGNPDSSVTIDALSLNMTAAFTTGANYFVNFEQTGDGNGVLVDNDASAATSGAVAFKSRFATVLASANAGVFETIGGTTLYARQTGATSSSSAGAVFQAQRDVTLGGGAALSGPVIRGMDDSNTTGDLLSLERPALTYKFRVTNTGELTFVGVSADGTGKALCVKADANIGTCTDAVNGSGICTCS